MHEVSRFIEYFGEGVVGMLALLVIPTIILLIDRKHQHPEKKSELSLLLENHVLDRLIHMARGGGD